MYIDLNTIKKHLRIDQEYTDDDQYLLDLETVAEDSLERYLDVESLSSLVKEDGMLPAALIHAMLLLIGNYYNNRESVTELKMRELPLAYQHLVSLYKNYSVA